SGPPWHGPSGRGRRPRAAPGRWRSEGPFPPRPRAARTPARFRRTRACPWGTTSRAARRGGSGAPRAHRARRAARSRPPPPAPCRSAPCLESSFFEFGPSTGELSTKFCSTGRLALQELAGHEGGGGPAGPGGQLADALLSHHRVLVVAEEVLQLLGALDEALGRVADRGRDHLGGVARPLDLDPELVQRLVGGLIAEGLGRPADTLEGAGGRVHERGLAIGDPGGPRGLVQRGEQAQVALAAEAGDQRVPDAPALGLERPDEAGGAPRGRGAWGGGTGAPSVWGET